MLVAYALVLRFWGLVYTDAWEPESAGILAQWVYGQVGYSGWIPSLIALLLVFIEAWMLNALVLRDRMGKDANLFPGVFYILICSSIPSFLHLSPLHLANFFYILALFELFSIYKKPSCTVNLFNSGLWIAIGSLFYPSYLVLFIFSIIVINSLRSLKLGDILIVLTGVIVPYIYAGVYYFWTDRLTLFWGEQFPIKIGLPGFALDNEVLYYISVVFFGLLILVVLFSWSGFLMKNIIQVQKKINMLYSALFVSVLGVFFIPMMSLDTLLFLAAPLGVLLSFNFTNMPRQRAEVLHLILVILILYFHYLVFNNQL